MSLILNKKTSHNSTHDNVDNTNNNNNATTTTTTTTNNDNDNNSNSNNTNNHSTANSKGAPPRPLLYPILSYHKLLYSSTFSLFYFVISILNMRYTSIICVYLCVCIYTYIHICIYIYIYIHTHLYTYSPERSVSLSIFSLFYFVISGSLPP